MPDEQEFDFSTQESPFQKTKKYFQKIWKTNRKRIIRLYIISLVIGIYLGGWIIQTLRLVIGRQPYIYWDPISMLYFFFTTPSFFLGVLFSFVITFMVVAFWAIRQKPYYHDDEQNVDVLYTGEGGNAHFMTDEEERRVFWRAKDIRNLKKQVLGYDKQDYLCAKRDEACTSPNTVIVGGPGSGKGVSQVFPHILQTFREGQSLIVTDSKGVLYEETEYIAEKMGYEVKVINFKPEEMKNSDGMEFMSTIHSEVGAENMASIIMDNSNGNEEQRKDFWYICEKNLLKGLILYVKFQYPPEERTLISIFDILVNQGQDGIDIIAQNAQPSDTYYAPLRIFYMSDDKVKQSAFGGLSTRLSLFSTQIVRNVLTHNEIDFTAPLKRKCAYYIIIPDTGNPMEFLSCLFFTTLFKELIDTSESVYKEDPPVHVRFIMDEFRATGSIPEFANYLSVARSRKLSIEFILQNPSQLEEMYGEEVTRTILNDCSTKILLRSTDNDTLEYFSKLTGERTILSRGTTYTEAKLDPMKLHPVTGVRTTAQKRALMTASDIKNLDNDHLLLIIDENVAILRKFYYYKDHPFYPVMQKHKVKTTDHMPAWRQALIDAGEDVMDPYEALEKREAEEKERKKNRQQGQPEEENQEQETEGKEEYEDEEEQPFREKTEPKKKTAGSAQNKPGSRINAGGRAQSGSASQKSGTSGNRTGTTGAAQQRRKGGYDRNSVYGQQKAQARQKNKEDQMNRIKQGFKFKDG